EGRGGPFPNIARHLAPAKGAIPSRECRDIDTAEHARIQIGLGGRRWRIPPGLPPLAAGPPPAGRRGLATGRHFPFRFGRQTAARPLTIRVSFIPRDMNDRRMRSQWDHRLELPLTPPLAC